MLLCLQLLNHVPEIIGKFLFVIINNKLTIVEKIELPYKK